MFTKEEFLKLCEKNNIQAFETLTEYDEDTDILLATDDINEFIRFCTSFNINCIFYNLELYEGKDVYKLDEKNILNEIKKHLNEIQCVFYNSKNYHMDNEEYEKLLSTYTEEIKKEVKLQNNNSLK